MLRSIRRRAVVAALVTLAAGTWASATPGEAITQRSVIILGDSIINGNKPGIEAALADAGVPSWTIDSKSGRMITTATTINGNPVSSGLSAVDAVRASGLDSEFWVVELGTNNLGMIRNCGCLDRVAFARSLIEPMLARIGDRRIAWVTVRAASHLEESRAFNQALAELAAERPRVSVIDWYQLSEGHPEWFVDGVHPSLAGVAAFADLLAGAVADIWPDPDRPTCATAPSSTTTSSTTSTSVAPPPPGIAAASAQSTAVRLGRVTSGSCPARP